jgi:hypothetical protein
MLPALPLPVSRSATATPRVLSPKPEMNTVIEELREIKLQGGDESDNAVQMAPG